MGKVLSLIEKLEIIFNKLIIKFCLVAIATFIDLVPKVVKEKLRAWEQQLLTRKQNLIEKSKTSAQNIVSKSKEKITYVKTQTNETITKVKNIDYKNQYILKKSEAIHFYKTANFKKIFLTGLSAIGLFFAKIWNFIKAQLSFPNLATYCTLGCIAFGSGYIIYSNVNKIANHGRKPASIKRMNFGKQRPAYYKEVRRHFLITHLKLPIYYAKDKRKITSLTLDFNLITSNRGTLKFIEKHQSRLRDHLLMNVEQVSAEFPLIDEGKGILKDKILEEANNFLKNNKVEGGIQDIQILYVLGT